MSYCFVIFLILQVPRFHKPPFGAETFNVEIRFQLGLRKRGGSSEELGFRGLGFSGHSQSIVYSPLKPFSFHSPLKVHTLINSVLAALAIIAIVI